MKDATTPSRYSVPDNAVLTDALFDNAERWPDHVAFSRKVGGDWTGVTSRQFAEQVAALAAGLMQSGIEVGERVALMAHTSYEWMLCDYAIWAAGAITVPIYETSSVEQIQWCLADSGASAVFVETPGHEGAVNKLLDQLPALRRVWQIQAGALDDLSAQGATITPDEVNRRRHEVNAATMATIVYTSGTTGRPKGCQITHANLLAQIGNVSRAHGVNEVVFNETKSTLLFLPLAHILARLIQLTAVHCRVRLGHLGDLSQLPIELKAFAPTSVLAVPRVFEKLYNAAEHQARAAGHGRIFDRAASTADQWSRSLDTGGPGLVLRARHTVFDRLVYAKLREVMGGRVEYAVSGGAPLGASLGHFFRGAGITILEGYGLTETCAGVTLNLPGLQRIGSVGRPEPGTEVRIAADGEVLLRGAQVFHGYWHNEAATRDMLDEDNWLSSGDLGQLDDEGYLTITGRKKDLIVTAAGKNVAPEVLEDRLRSHWLISQCVVVGDARPYIGALVTIDEDAFTIWKGDHGKEPAATVADLREDKDLLAAVQRVVDDANLAVSHAEAIKRFRLLVDDFTESGRYLTPTLKVKRNVVMHDFARDIDALYDAPR